VANNKVETTTSALDLRVFISYSWDSDAHKKWVLAFGERLRNDGIDAIIDQTHLALGARSPEFMERSVRESNRVLVICTETYKRRFDNREGGAGYEGHIISGEIINEVGRNKFIPVLRNGDWKTAVPTALLGVYGVDLRNDSSEEYRKLIENLHGVSRVAPVGPRPAWVPPASGPTRRNIVTLPNPETDLDKFLRQRGKPRPETEVQRMIWSKPRWQMWIHPTQFRAARFQNIEQCRQFILSSYVRVQGYFPYPWVSAESVQVGDEWVAGEIDHSETNRVSYLESWFLYRSGQFVYNRTFDEIPQLGDRVHVFEILDAATAAFELAARMADRGVLSPEAVVRFELYGIDGRKLTWPQNLLGDMDNVGPDSWSQDETLTVEKYATTDELKTRKRELALETALEIYSHFGWLDPPTQRLRDEQTKRFG
jgi:hypothetical protein